MKEKSFFNYLIKPHKNTFFQCNFFHNLFAFYPIYGCLFIAGNKRVKVDTNNK